MKRVVAASVAGLALVAFLAYQPVAGDTSKLTFTPAQPESSEPAVAQSRNSTSEPSPIVTPQGESNSPSTSAKKTKEIKVTSDDDDDFDEHEDHEDYDDDFDEHEDHEDYEDDD